MRYDRRTAVNRFIQATALSLVVALLGTLIYCRAMAMEIINQQSQALDEQTAVDIEARRRTTEALIASANQIIAANELAAQEQIYVEPVEPEPVMILEIEPEEPEIEIPEQAPEPVQEPVKTPERTPVKQVETKQPEETQTPAVVEQPVVQEPVQETPAPDYTNLPLTPEIIRAMDGFDSACHDIAQMLYKEIRGGSDRAVAAVVWCACNRAATGGRRLPADVVDQIKRPAQFAYSASSPVYQRLYDIAADVLVQWMMEPYTSEGINRVLPEDYRWFSGDGRYNTFRNSYSRPYQTITVK